MRTGTLMIRMTILLSSTRGYLGWHVATKGGAPDDKAGALADSLADLIKGH